MRKVRNIIFASLATVTVFFAGIAIACDGNYAEDWDTFDCVVLDQWTNTTACKNINNTYKRCWNCDQEKFLCIEGSDLVEKDGPTFNCQAPGAACQ